MAEPWEVLFTRALALLQRGEVAQDDWVVGGGTVLRLKFNHRESKDIDIFLSDRQLLSRLSPRVNDAVEANLLDYAEQAQHIRLEFREGEIDFIVARQISKMKPERGRIFDAVVNVEHPVEIVAKKIYHRADVFMPRDVFDLAVVSKAHGDIMLKNAETFAQALPILTQRINALERSGELERRLERIAVLPGGENIRGKEVEICKQFLKDAERTPARLGKAETAPLPRGADDGPWRSGGSRQ